MEKEKKEKKETTKSQPDIYRISLRTNRGSKPVTSITLNVKLISLWCLIILLTEENHDEQTNYLETFSNENSLKKYISDFVYKNLKDWKGITGKGLSSFMSSCIFTDICNRLCSHLNVDKEDAKRFFDSVVSSLRQ